MKINLVILLKCDKSSINSVHNFYHKFELFSYIDNIIDPNFSVRFKSVILPRLPGSGNVCLNLDNALAESANDQRNDTKLDT